ncbi:MAG: hypothetical protein ABI837_12275 [Acidobacteriota bacterium]
MPILKCRYPFPSQDPPVNMPEECSAKCPHYDRSILAIHDTIAEDDPQLLRTLRSFAEWLYMPGQNLDEQIRYAAQLYVRPDHSGTCIPKTLLFAHMKHLQFTSYGPVLELSGAAQAAFRGERAASWPDGEPAAGTTWNEMFGHFNRSYE